MIEWSGKWQVFQRSYGHGENLRDVGLIEEKTIREFNTEAEAQAEATRLGTVWNGHIERQHRVMPPMCEAQLYEPF